MGNVASKKLEDKQMKFVAEYLSSFNATKAAIAAGYAKNSARVTASRLLAKANIKAEIAARLDSEGITPARVKAEIAKYAFQTDLADFQPLFEGTSLQDLRESGVDTSLLKEIKATRRLIGKGDDAEPVEDVVIRLHDPLVALDKLGKILALFIDHGILHVDDEVPDKYSHVMRKHGKESGPD